MCRPRTRARSGTLGVIALTLAAGLLAATGSPAQVSGGDRVVEAVPPKPIADFVLTDQNGKPFRLSRLKGRPVLVFFGFTNCPLACPTAMAQLLSVTRSADPAAREARVVMISTDGQRDTPAVMKEYLARISPEFIGLTGPPKEVGVIAAQFSAVFFRGRAADKSGNYLVDHTTQIYLLDRAGRLRATFFDAPVDTLARVTSAVAAEDPALHNPR
jgi:protein SCO1/2